MSDPPKRPESHADPQPAPPTPPAGDSVPVLESRDLLQGRREVCIRHQGSLYRLRLTRSGKLILHK